MVRVQDHSKTYIKIFRKRKALPIMPPLIFYNTPIKRVENNQIT